MTNYKDKELMEWDVNGLCYHPRSPYAVIVLNGGLMENKDLEKVRKYWENAALRVCVDGGTNGFYDLMFARGRTGRNPGDEDMDNGRNVSEDMDNGRNVSEDMDNGIKVSIPDIICGDFDSIRPNLLNEFERLGTKIVPTPDQSETDFTKSLLVLGDELAERKLEINHALVLATINSTRFDHTIAHVNTLYKIADLLSYPVIVICGRSLFWLLNSGRHCIKVPSVITNSTEDSWCGYASFADPVVVSTSGLKWDIQDQIVSFGKLISTSNTYPRDDKDGEVYVTCSGPLLWFMGWDQMVNNVPCLPSI